VSAVSRRPMRESQARLAIKWAGLRDHHRALSEYLISIFSWSSTRAHIMIPFYNSCDFVFLLNDVAM
jgi:hypothetical protein